MSRSTRNVYCFSVTLAVLISCLGCFQSGPKAPPGMPKLIPTTIILNQDGAPLAEASVTFYPDPMNDWSAGGSSDEQGRVEVFTGGQFKGLAAGKYKVTVSKTERDPLDFSGDPEKDYGAYEKAIAKQKSYRLVDPKYSELNTTPLVVNIEAGKPVEPIDLGKAVRVQIK